MVQVQSQRRIAKPLGLYIITIFDFIAVGLIPLVMIVVAVRKSEMELPFVAVLISVALPVLVMAVSVWAFIGDYVARYLLLTFVTLMALVIIFNGLDLFSSGSVSGRSGVRTGGFILRAVFWLAINWWYFNRAHVVAYFKQKQ